MEKKSDKYFKIGLIIFFVAVLALSLAACGKDGHQQSSDHKGKLDVKTTVYPLKSFAQQIGGKYVNVEDSGYRENSGNAENYWQCCTY